jgi:hypothetical protein
MEGALDLLSEADLAEKSLLPVVDGAISENMKGSVVDSTRCSGSAGRTIDWLARVHQPRVLEPWIHLAPFQATL